MHQLHMDSYKDSMIHKLGPDNSNEANISISSGLAEKVFNFFKKVLGSSFPSVFSLNNH